LQQIVGIGVERRIRLNVDIANLGTERAADTRKIAGLQYLHVPRLTGCRCKASFGLDSTA
jgi:hypothetical protein